MPTLCIANKKLHVNLKQKKDDASVYCVRNAKQQTSNGRIGRNNYVDVIHLDTCE